LGSRGTGPAAGFGADADAGDVTGFAPEDCASNAVGARAVIIATAVTKSRAAVLMRTSLGGARWQRQLNKPPVRGEVTASKARAALAIDAKTFEANVQAKCKVEKDRNMAVDGL
jgi:hypothetical protein